MEIIETPFGIIISCVYLCSFNFKSEYLFRNHLRDAHAGVLPEDQQQAIVKLSE